MTPPQNNWKSKLSTVMYKTDTPAGYLFDVGLIFSILFTSLLIIIESVEWNTFCTLWSWIAFGFPFARLFPVLRTLRLLRMFAVFKMARYVEESGTLIRALRANHRKSLSFSSPFCSSS